MSKKHRPDVRALNALAFEDGVLFHDPKGAALDLPQAPCPLADSHGHLTHFHGHEPAAALARAAVAGVRLLVVPLDPTGDARDARSALDELTRWEEAAVGELALLRERCGLVPPVWEGVDTPRATAELPLDVRIVAGAHPYGAPVLDGGALEALELLLADRRCVGVGEIGLDVGPWNKAPLEAQEQAFRAQLEIARAHGLPVELHLRDEEDGRTTAHDLALRVLEETGVPEAGCDLHCYTSGPDVMAPFARMGCHIAFGGAATFPRSEDIRAAARACPTHLLLSETDSPYMAPVPLRGMECEPAMVAFSADLVARERAEAGASARDETYRALWENALGLFGLGDACRGGAA